MKNDTGELHGSILRLLREIDQSHHFKAKRLRFMTMATMTREVRLLKERFDDLWLAEGDLYWYRESPLSDRGLSILTGIFGYHEDAERIIAANRSLIGLDRDLFRAFLAGAVRNDTACRNLFEIFFGRGTLSLEQLAVLENRYLERYIETFRLFDSTGLQGLGISARDLQNIREIIGNYEAIIDTLSDDIRLYRRFRRDFWSLYREPAHLTIIGYGEISTVMQISGREQWVWKKMPPFPDLAEVLEYVRVYGEYRRLLTEEAGLAVPEQRVSYFNHGGYYSVYAGQEKLEMTGLCHVLIRKAAEAEALDVFGAILRELSKVFRYNRAGGRVQIGIDGQLSNWILQKREDQGICYIDTSSPLYRVEGKEQLNTELFIKNAPSFLRALIRAFFLADVVNRYYDMRSVIIDIIANLHKEKRPDLIEPFLPRANAFILENGIPGKPVTRKEIDSYYSQDAFIWRFFQFSRRVDKFISESIRGKKYAYRLPGKVER